MLLPLDFRMTRLLLAPGEATCSSRSHLWSATGGRRSPAYGAPCPRCQESLRRGSEYSHCNLTDPCSRRYADKPRPCAVSILSPVVQVFLRGRLQITKAGSISANKIGDAKSPSPSDHLYV